MDHSAANAWVEDFAEKLTNAGAQAREVVPDCLLPDKHWLQACGPW